MPHCDFIESKCPFSEYGCEYYSQRVDFSCSTCKSVQLGFNASTGLFVFEFDSNTDKKFCQSNPIVQNQFDVPSENLTSRRNYWDLESIESSTTSNLNLLDLPFEVLYEIINHLDSNTLFNLSITSKVK